MNQSFAFVQLGSSCICFFQGIKERCVDDGVTVCCSLVVHCLPTKCQWTTNTLGMYKEFCNNFFRFVVHIHASRKIRFKRLRQHGSQNNYHQFISSNFSFQKEREREIPILEFFCPFYSPILPFHLDSSKARIKKMHEQNKGAFDMVYNEM